MSEIKHANEVKRIKESEQKLAEKAIARGDIRNAKIHEDKAKKAAELAKNIK